MKLYCNKFPEFEDEKNTANDDDDYNPFTRGSLLANMRESSDSYIVEPKQNQPNKWKDGDKVNKVLDFSKKVNTNDIGQSYELN